MFIDPSVYHLYTTHLKNRYLGISSFMSFRFLSFFLLPSIIFAEGVENLQEIDYAADFLKMFFWLFVVVVFLLVSTFFLKKYTRSRMRLTNHTYGIKVLEKRSLNPKASLYLIDVLGKGLVIAESPQGIHLIAEFSEEKKVEQLLAEQTLDDKPALSFSEILQKIKTPWTSTATKVAPTENEK